MVKGARLVAELVADIEHHRHFVGAVAMILNEDVAFENTRQRFEPEVAFGRFASFAARTLLFISIDLAAIFGGVDPRAAETRDLAHAGGGRASAAAVTAFGIFAACHFERVRRTGEFHLLDGHRRDILHAHTAAAEQIGRAGQDKKACHATGAGLGEDGILRPDRMFGPYMRGVRIDILVAVGMALDARGREDAEV